MRHVLYQLLHQVQDCFEPWVKIVRGYFTLPNLALETFVTNLKLAFFFLKALFMLKLCACMFLPII
jgi:hypothetical protein